MSGSSGEVTRIPGGTWVCGLTAASGVGVTLLGAVVAMLPPAGSANPALIALKVVGGSALLLAVGLVFYFRGRLRDAVAR